MLLGIGLLQILQIVGVLVFCTGFFPQKNVLGGEATFEINEKLQLKTKPPFDKLILVVIDALRSDFIFDESKSGFNFVHSKLNSGEAWGFTAYSNPPTVTLPRLKGITTGSTPNFLDAILNVAEDDSTSNIKDQDSWPMQFHKNNYKMRFFGDDTWLKLLPREIFDEYEGTNSFFVSDFEQVDLNVTRHVPDQLNNQNKWDVLILHYLGLDHIGHKGGANSIFMPAKHEEMDKIIEEIYKGVSDSTLMIVMGDHGMNDVGNHGGSSAGETSAGLVFLSKKLAKYELPENQKGVKMPTTLNDPSTYQYLTSIQQMDLVPTISALFNVPFPKNSVGVLIPEFLQLLNRKVIDTKILENYRQLLEVAKMDKTKLETYLSMKNIDRELILKHMRNIQEQLIGNATDYNYKNIYIGSGILLLTTIATLAFASYVMKSKIPLLITLAVSLLLGLSCFGSSFVEEEHQLWWWMITGSIFVSYINSITKGLKKFQVHFLLFVCVRLIRGWNNTGQKTVYAYVISNILNEKPYALWTLNILAFLVVSFKGFANDPASFISAFILSMIALNYKATWSIINKEAVPPFLEEWVWKLCVAFTGSNENAFDLSLIPMANFFFKFFFALCFIKVTSVLLKVQKASSLFKDITKYITILLMFLSSSKNIPQFLLFEILSSCMKNILKTQYDDNVYLISLISLCFQNFAFFQFGGTNSIATIDLANAYHGVSEDYNIYVVGVLMATANFAPAIFWVMFGWNTVYLDKSRTEKKEIFTKSRLPILIFSSIFGCCLMAACYALRYHLFIWSVFSPKLCYYAGWTLFMNTIIGWILEGVLVLFA